MAVASPTPDVYDYWSNTPAFDALNLLSESDISAAIGAASILATLFITYSTLRSPTPRASSIFGHLVMASMVTGFTSYALLVQVEAFDVAHWLGSFSGSLLAIHIPLFVSFLALAVQIQKLSSLKPSAKIAVAFATAGLLSLLLGFFLSFWMFFTLATVDTDGHHEWFLVLAFLALFVVVWFVARYPIGLLVELRFRKSDKAPSPAGNVPKAIAWAAIAFVAFEIVLRLVGFLLIDAGACFWFSEPTGEEDYPTKDVGVNLMLKTKREIYRDDSQKTVSDIYYDFDQYGYKKHIEYKDGDGNLTRISSRDFTYAQDHVDLIVEHNYEIATCRLNDRGEVTSYCEWNLNDAGPYWCYMTNRLLKGEYVGHYLYYLDKDLNLNSVIRYDYDEDTGRYLGCVFMRSDGSVIDRWTYVYDAFGSDVSRSHYEGDSEQPSKTEVYIPSESWVTVDNADTVAPLRAP